MAPLFDEMNKTLLSSPLGTDALVGDRKVKAIFSGGEQIIDPLAGERSVHVIVSSPTLFLQRSDFEEKPGRGTSVVLNHDRYQVLTAIEDAGGGLTLELERHGP